MGDKPNRIHGWWDDYQCLNLCNGKMDFICEDDEDMINISYDDGMLIDIGKPIAVSHYLITVVSPDDEIGWQHPISEIEVTSKQELVTKIQETILKFRQM